MSRASSSALRCPACLLHRARCVCAHTPVIHTRTRVVLVVHHDEVRKPTNTGRLAQRALTGARTVVVGEKDRPITEPIVDATERALLLFPADDARVIAKDEDDPRPVTLVVPDGTWRQAGKMRARVPGLAGLPCVTVDDDAPTRYRLRTERRAGGLATVEAIARALRVLDGDAAADALLAYFERVVQASLATGRRPPALPKS